MSQVIGSKIVKRFYKRQKGPPVSKLSGPIPSCDLGTEVFKVTKDTPAEEEPPKANASVVTETELHPRPIPLDGRGVPTGTHHVMQPTVNPEDINIPWKEWATSEVKESPTDLAKRALMFAVWMVSKDIRLDTMPLAVVKKNRISW